MMEILYKMNVQSLIVEGGPTLLQYFIDHYFWNEIRIITNTTLFIKNGVPAPILPDEVEIVMDDMFENDRVIVMI
jgi:diaminohydroxyphosphoribosylaminopyrimidine deaminase/5-amino-6-(5-phosphoribosylamino)uracil reductase